MEESNVPSLLKQLALKLRREGNISGLKELRHAIKTKDYDNDRRYLKTVYFPELVSVGGRYPDYAPQATAVFSSHFTSTINIMAPKTNVLVDMSNVDNGSSCLYLSSDFGGAQFVYGYTSSRCNDNSIASPAQNAAANVFNIDIAPRSQFYASPITMYESFRLVGGSVQLEFIGGTSFDSGWLACKLDENIERDYMNHQPRLEVNAEGEMAEAGMSDLFRERVQHQGPVNDPFVTSYLTALSQLRIGARVTNIKCRLQDFSSTGFISQGDFTTGVRMFVPAVKQNQLMTVKTFLKTHTPVIVGCINCPSVGQQVGGFAQFPAVRITVSRWFEGVPLRPYSLHVPTDHVQPSYSTREFTESPLKTTPNIFKITPQSLEADAAFYMSRLGYASIT